MNKNSKGSARIIWRENIASRFGESRNERGERARGASATECRRQQNAVSGQAASADNTERAAANADPSKMR